MQCCILAAALSVAISAPATAEGFVAPEAKLPADNDGGRPIGLDQMLEHADQNAPAVLVARSRRARGTAEVEAASPWLPENPQVFAATGPRIVDGAAAVDISASLSQQFLVAGERGLRIQAAEGLVEQLDAEIEDVRWTVHAEVHAAFHRALVERSRLALAEEVLTYEEGLVTVVERRVAVGDVAPFTKRLAEVEVAQAKQAAIAARQRYRSARLQLAQLAGWPIADLPSPTGALDVPRTPDALDRLVAAAEQKLPALRALDAAARAAAVQVAAADRALFPQPVLGVQWTQEGHPIEGANQIILGTLSVPIPSFQLNQGERARARADQQIAQAEIDALRRQLQGNVALARSEVVAAAERVSSYGTEILPRFSENLMMLRRAFELGEIDLLDLSVGRERLLRAQSDALDAHLDYFVAVAALERAVGTEVFGTDIHHEDSP